MPSHLRVRERLGLRSRSPSAQSTAPSLAPSLSPIPLSPSPSAASAPGQSIPGGHSPTQPPAPIHSLALQSSSPAQVQSGNRALDKAVQEHLKQLRQTEQEAFRQASEHLDAKNLLASIRSYDDAHKDSSLFRPQAEKVSKFLGLLDRFMGGVTIAIQASPDISSLVVGGVRLALDIVVRFVEFFGKFSEMLLRFGEWLPLLESYSKNSKLDIIVDAVANVYGDLLKFSREACRIFRKDDGSPVKWTSVRTFFRLQWEPFSETFGKIEQNTQHHVDIVLHSAQASQMELLQTMTDQQNTETRRQILEWISNTDKVDFEKAHEMIHAKKHPRTSEWLIHTKNFQSWLSSPTSSLLWCHGKPGAGKSVLASNVLEHITKQYLFDQDTAVSFAYYNYQTTELGQLSTVIAALLKQLCRQAAEIPSWLVKHREDALSPATASTPESYIKLGKTFENVYLIIDALDECPEAERHAVLRFIRGIVSQDSGLPCVKVFVTSRRETDIAEAFTQIAAPVIEIEAGDVASDIKIYVRDEVERLRVGDHGKKLYIRNEALADKIIETLTNKAEGMFLWVNLQLENLCKISEAKKDRVVEQALNKLPRGLEKTYLRVLDQICNQDEQLRELSLHCLMWVLYAKRPLRTRELRHAIAALALGKTSQTLADLKSDLDDIDVILKACGNLIMAEDQRYHPDERIIRPIHYSVQEFFTNQSKVVPDSDYLKSLRDADDAHAKLAGVCLSYLTLAVSPPRACEMLQLLNERVRNAAFGHYAATSFDYHISACVNVPPDLIYKVKGFLDTPGLFLAGVVQLRSLNYSGFVLHQDFDPVLFQVSSNTIIHITSLSTIPAICADVETISLSPYVLHQACRSGDFSVVSRLVDMLCDVNELDTEGNSPVYHASERGHLKVVELLLSRGGNPSSQGRYYGNALQAAMAKYHDAVAKLLISTGADFNIQVRQYGSALQAASYLGHQDIVEILLSKGADVNLPGGDYGSALQAAAYMGEKDIVGLLLSKGADVNLQGGFYGTALNIASAKGNKHIVELLLYKGADVTLQSGNDGFALQAASYEGKKDIVELLLSKGADVNLQGGYHGSALQAAAYRREKDIVELLLSKGADVNLQGGYHGSALQAAAAATATKSHSNEYIVKILLSYRADVNVEGGKYGNALLAASANGKEELVRILLDEGADVKALVGKHGSALQAASYGEGIARYLGEGQERLKAHLNIISLLLENGASIDARGGEYGNALQTAISGFPLEGYRQTAKKYQDLARKARQDIVELLLTRGANVGISGRWRNGMQAAQQQERPELVDLLIAYGAEDEEIDKEEWVYEWKDPHNAWKEKWKAEKAAMRGASRKPPPSEEKAAPDNQEQHDEIPHAMNTADDDQDLAGLLQLAPINNEHTNLSDHIVAATTTSSS